MKPERWGRVSGPDVNCHCAVGCTLAGPMRTRMAPGATMPARDFVRLMFERIPSTRDICAYGDGVVRATEWAICGDPDGSPGYARSREKGMLEGVGAETGDRCGFS